MKVIYINYNSNLWIWIITKKIFDKLGWLESERDRKAPTGLYIDILQQDNVYKWCTKTTKTNNIHIYTYTSIEKKTQYNVGYIKRQQQLQHIKTTTTKQYQSNI